MRPKMQLNRCCYDMMMISGSGLIESGNLQIGNDVADKIANGSSATLYAAPLGKAYRAPRDQDAAGMLKVSKRPSPQIASC